MDKIYYVDRTEFEVKEVPSSWLDDFRDPFNGERLTYVEAHKRLLLYIQQVETKLLKGKLNALKVVRELEDETIKLRAEIEAIEREIERR